MSKVLVIFLWVAIVLWLLTVSTNLITQPDTMCNLFGGALLRVRVPVVTGMSGNP